MLKYTYIITCEFVCVYIYKKKKYIYNYIYIYDSISENNLVIYI